MRGGWVRGGNGFWGWGEGECDFCNLSDWEVFVMNQTKTRLKLPVNPPRRRLGGI